MKEFSKKWAIILGGSSGLGLASAKKLAMHGLNVCIVHRTRKQDLSDLEIQLTTIKESGVAVKSFNNDALKNETIDLVLATFQPKSVKLLLHSIAKGSVKPMLANDQPELTRDDFNITIHAMALSWYDWSKALLIKDLFSENARNLAFTSEGNRKTWPFYGAVSVAKASLEALMRNMALEFAKKGITTNCIQAGVTQTRSFSMIPDNERLAEISKKKNPFKRLTQPDDIANVVYLLCQNEANWINGTVIKADGGESLQ